MCLKGKILYNLCAGWMYVTEQVNVLARNLPLNLKIWHSVVEFRNSFQSSKYFAIIYFIFMVFRWFELAIVYFPILANYICKKKTVYHVDKLSIYHLLHSVVHKHDSNNLCYPLFQPLRLRFFLIYHDSYV